MGLVELTVTLSLAERGLIPQARAWVDLQPDGSLHSELELPLHPLGPGRWMAVMGIGEPTPECFFYRLGIVAHVGAQWSLKVRDRDLGRDILADTDTLTSPKCWLIGSCALRSDALGPDPDGRIQPPDASRRGVLVHAPPPRQRATNVVFLAHRRRR
jgi:hypothetical protein